MIRTTSLSSVPNRAGRSLVAIVCAALLAPGETVLLAQAAPPATAQAAAEEPKLPPEQLDALAALVALYPDPLLGQVLAASTYPLEIVQLQQWLAKNKGLKDKALADAVAKPPWDPSIQSMAALPDVVKRQGNDIQWRSSATRSSCSRATSWTPSSGCARGPREPARSRRTNSRRSRRKSSSRRR